MRAVSKARRRSLEIEGHENYRGIDDAGLQGCESRGRDAGREGVVVALLQPVGHHHPLKVDSGEYCPRQRR